MTDPYAFPRIAGSKMQEELRGLAIRVLAGASTSMEKELAFGIQCLLECEKAHMSLRAAEDDRIARKHILHIVRDGEYEPWRDSPAWKAARAKSKLQDYLTPDR